MKPNRIQPHSWSNETALLQCINCRSGLTLDAEPHFACSGCLRSYPVQRDILQAMGTLEGNNKATSEWYNSPLWPRFRFWEGLGFVLNGGDTRARRQILRHLPDLSKTRVLEVAIGDGFDVPLFPRDCRIYGVDISRVQLENCLRRNPDRDLHLALGEAENLPFRDDSFDHVVSIGGFNFYNNQLQALSEMVRVVKPGGLVVVADEVPYLANILVGRRIGLRWLDRAILSRFMLLGPDFADIVDRNRDLKIKPIVEQLPADWQFRTIWLGIGYCFFGHPKPARTKAQLKIKTPT
jgi:ubiquinone/menaquinone biosynthesis C-methylase UbiE